MNPYRPAYTPNLPVHEHLSGHRDPMSGHLIKVLVEESTRSPVNPVRQMMYQTAANSGFANQFFHNLFLNSMRHLDYTLTQGTHPNQAYDMVAEAQCRYHASIMLMNTPALINALDQPTRAKAAENVQEFQKLMAAIDQHEKTQAQQRAQQMTPYGQMVPMPGFGMAQPAWQQPTAGYPMPAMQMMPQPNGMYPPPSMPAMPMMQPQAMPGMYPQPMPGMYPQTQMMGVPNVPNPAMMPAMAYPPQQRMPMAAMGVPMGNPGYGQPNPSNPTGARLGTISVGPGTPVQTHPPQVYQQHPQQPQGNPAVQPYNVSNVPPAQVSQQAPSALMQHPNTVQAQQHQPEPEPVKPKPVWTPDSPHSPVIDLSTMRYDIIYNQHGSTYRIKELGAKMEFNLHDTRRFFAPLPGDMITRPDTAAFQKAMGSVVQAKKIAAIRREKRTPEMEGAVKVVKTPVHLGDVHRLARDCTDRKEVAMEVCDIENIEVTNDVVTAYRLFRYYDWYLDHTSNAMILANATSYSDLLFALGTLYADNVIPHRYLNDIDEAIASQINMLVMVGMGLDIEIGSFREHYPMLKSALLRLDPTGELNSTFESTIKEVLSYSANPRMGKEVNAVYSADGKDDGEQRIAFARTVEVYLIPVSAASIAYGGEERRGALHLFDPMHRALLPHLKTLHAEHVEVVTNDDQEMLMCKSVLADLVCVATKEIFG